MINDFIISIKSSEISHLLYQNVRDMRLDIEKFVQKFIVCAIELFPLFNLHIFLSNQLNDLVIIFYHAL